jgi:hypothetical protein
MKKTLIIAYNGGAYGTYLEWALNSLMTSDSIKEPFTDLGSSHASTVGHRLHGIKGFKTYIESDRHSATVRLHPKNSKEESLRDNLDFLVQHCSGVILLYPDREHELMCVSNYMTKIWSGDPYDGAMSYINHEDIYQGYDIEPDTDLRTIPAWIRREHMSFNLFNSWHDQVEWYFPDHWSNPRAMIITTKQLFENFTDVLINIENFWKVKYRRPIADMLPWHNKMISLQANLGKDQLCADIIQATINSQEDHFEFGPLCLTSQAWIQHQLRLRKYEIRCHDLDVFPQDTESLRSLIYKFG